jgi:hypothetical protein
VQIVASDYERASPESYHSFAVAVERAVKKLSKDDHWKLQFVLKGVAFKFEGSSGNICPSLWIWFFASAGDKDHAVHSRERLIASLTSAVSRGGVLAKLATPS